MDANTVQEARLLRLNTSVLDLTLAGKRDLGAVIDLLQIVKDDPMFAKRFGLGAGVQSLGTFPIILEGRATSVVELIKQGKYDWFSEWITAGRFPIVRHKSTPRQIELMQLDHDWSWEEGLEVLADRHLEQPTPEDCFYFGIQHSQQQRRPIVFLHEPVQSPDGRPFVLVLGGYADRRGLDLSFTRGRWDRNFVFVGVRKVA